MVGRARQTVMCQKKVVQSYTLGGRKKLRKPVQVVRAGIHDGCCIAVGLPSDSFDENDGISLYQQAKQLSMFYGPVYGIIAYEAKKYTSCIFKLSIVDPKIEQYYRFFVHATFAREPPEHTYPYKQTAYHMMFVFSRLRG